MIVRGSVDVRGKLAILADAAKYDASCASSGSKGTRKGTGLGSTEGMGICHSYTPDGRCVSLLKVLLTNYCIYDCKYCINRVTSDVPRARFTVDEVVNLTLEFYRRNYIEGLFLSSGIIQSPDYTMEQLVAVAKALRDEHGYRGYIHLKTIPGCDERLLEQAGLYADRMSVNIELPTPADLTTLAPDKKPAEIAAGMEGIRDRVADAKAERVKSRAAPRFAPAGQSTQMIVGATPTTDRVIVANVDELYRSYKLKRVYYSAYSPIPHADARLPGRMPPLVREHRLYQADWLVRFYDFKADELLTEDEPNFDLRLDPKHQWAIRNPAFFPVDVNRAPKELLLRVPGLGVKVVHAIVGARRFRRLRIADLKKLRATLGRALPFIVAADHSPTDHAMKLARRKPAFEQGSLFDDADDEDAADDHVGSAASVTPLPPPMKPSPLIRPPAPDWGAAATGRSAASDALGPATWLPIFDQAAVRQRSRAPAGGEAPRA